MANFWLIKLILVDPKVDPTLIKDHGLSYDAAALLLKGTNGYSSLFYLILSDLCYGHLFYIHHSVIRSLICIVWTP